MRFELRRDGLIFGDRRGQASWGLRDAPRVVGLDGTVNIVKIVSLSPRVENLNLKKVIKVSYLNQESSQCFELKLDGNYTRMLRAILNKSWRQHSTRHQLHGHLPPITKTIQVRRTRHAGHCWRSRDELISDVLLWTPTHDRAKAGRPARTYIQQLCEDMGCCPEDLPEAMNDRVMHVDVFTYSYLGPIFEYITEKTGPYKYSNTVNCG